METNQQLIGRIRIIIVIKFSGIANRSKQHGVRSKTPQKTQQQISTLTQTEHNLTQKHTHTTTNPTYSNM